MAIPSLSFVHLLKNHYSLMHHLQYREFAEHPLGCQVTQFILGKKLKSSSSIITTTSLSTSVALAATSSSSSNESNAIDEESRRLLLYHKLSTLRSIGVDYGLSRTGIAITTGGYQPRPLTILSGRNNITQQQLASSIVDYVVSERATNIVLGLPLHKNGTASEQSALTRVFGLELLKELRRRCGPGVHVYLWDERYTSKEAAARIAAEAMARNRRIPSASDLSGELDADAACIILEHYYRDMGLDAEKMVFESDAMERECDEIYKANLEMEERLRMERMKERERTMNARREMMERNRALDEEAAVDGNTTRKKKKKKKRKR